MKRTFKVSDMLAVAWWNPGTQLDEFSLKKLHNELIAVNEQSKANIVHEMLKKGTSTEDLRTLYSHSVVTVFFIDEKAVAFLISPILTHAEKPIMHTGLMVIARNPGGNLMGLLFLINVCVSYENLGSYYATNISSTPSAVETFTEVVTNAWPGPDVNLKKCPQGYEFVLQKLKAQYLDLNFPDTDKIHIDARRFVMTSNSSGMGFTTNFHKVSRAGKFKYNLFCHTWIDYQKEEDIIQIGEFGFLKYLRSRYRLFKLQHELKKSAEAGKKKKNNEAELFSEKKRAS